MRPPAEQLIRDYLNRLSVAARTKLPSDDRRAFLARTREFIEQRSGGRDTADPAVVLRVLNDLGEPEAVVEHEHARLAALRSKREASAARAGLWKSRARAAGQGGEGEQGGSAKNHGSDKGAHPQPAPPPRPAPSEPQINGRPLTGEITISSRPVSARWKPGAPLREQQSRPHRIPRPRRGSSRQPPAGGPVKLGTDGDPSAANGPASALAAPRGTAPPAPAGPAGSVPPGPPAGSAEARPSATQKSGAGPGATGQPGAAPAGAAPAVRRHAEPGSAAPPVRSGTGSAAPTGQPGAASAGAAPAGQAGAATAGAAATGQRDAAPAAAQRAGTVSSGTVSSGTVSSGTAARTGLAGTAGAGSGPAASAPAGPPAPSPGTQRPGGPKGAADPSGNRGAAAGQEPSGGAATEAAPSPGAQQRAAVATPARLTTARQRRLQLIQPTDMTKGFAAAVADAWRRHRLEVIAVALLAIAGLIFPAPIWLVGFLLWLVGSALVLSSKLWTVGEKWLTVPGLVVLVIAGIAIAEALGGKRQDAAAYGDEALSAAATLFKIAMLLAAVYLGWRMQRGHRGTPAPPWVRRGRR